MAMAMALTIRTSPAYSDIIHLEAEGSTPPALSYTEEVEAPDPSRASQPTCIYHLHTTTTFLDTNTYILSTYLYHNIHHTHLAPVTKAPHLSHPLPPSLPHSGL